MGIASRPGALVYVRRNEKRTEDYCIGEDDSEEEETEEEEEEEEAKDNGCQIDGKTKLQRRDRQSRMQKM
jgi:hypothetical protein